MNWGFFVMTKKKGIFDVSISADIFQFKKDVAPVQKGMAVKRL